MPGTCRNDNWPDNIRDCSVCINIQIYKSNVTNLIGNIALLYIYIYSYIIYIINILIYIY